MGKNSNNKDINKIMHELGINGGKANYINASFLIDGNHTFLYCLEENQKKLNQLLNDVQTKTREERIERFKNNIIRHSKKQIQKNPESANTMIENLVELLYKDQDFEKEQIERLQKYRGEDIAISFTENLFIFQKEFEDIFIESMGLNPKDTKLNKETIIFDANLPEKKFAIKRAKEWKQNSNNEFDKKNIDIYINDLDKDLFPFYKEGKHIKAPYDSKESYLDFLQKDALIGDNTEIILGKKYINWRPGLISNEKGVDTQLVIKGCEYANNKDTKIVCLVTNDGDFEPLVKYLQSKGKIVFLLALENSRICKPLREAVGERYFNLDHEFFETAAMTAHYSEQVFLHKDHREMTEYFYRQP